MSPTHKFSKTWGMGVCSLLMSFFLYWDLLFCLASLVSNKTTLCALLTRSIIVRFREPSLVLKPGTIHIPLSTSARPITHSTKVTTESSTPICHAFSPTKLGLGILEWIILFRLGLFRTNFQCDNHNQNNSRSKHESAENWEGIAVSLLKSILHYSVIKFISRDSFYLGLYKVRIRYWFSAETCLHELIYYLFF